MHNKGTLVFRSIFFQLIILVVMIRPVIGQVQEIDIGEVIIEGNSIESAIQLRRHSVSGMYVIPQADLLSFGYSTAGDVIKNLPLVYLDGEPGVNRNVSIGGLDREYQAILINGKKPAGGEDSRDLKLDRIPVSMIARIEIHYNSPVSAGSSGVAGTVNIILKDEFDSKGLNLHLESNINTSSPLPGFKAEVEGSIKLGKTNVYGALSYSGYEREQITELDDASTDISGGVEEKVVTDIFGLNLASKRSTGSYSSLSTRGFFSWFDEDEFEIADVKRRKDGTLNVRDSETENDKLRYLISYDLLYEYRKQNNLLELESGFSNNFERRNKSQLQEKSDYFEEVKEFEDQNNSTFDLKLSYIRDSFNIGPIMNKLSTGVLYSINYRNTDRFNAVRPQGYLLWDVTDESYTMRENVVSSYGELSTTISPKMRMMSAIIYEYSFGGYHTNDSTGKHLFSHLSPSLHLKYDINDKLSLNFGAARHIARPAFMSMVPIQKIKIKKDLIEVGNPELIPSRSFALDMGGSYYINAGSYISATAYYKWVSDMIEMQYAGIDETSGYALYKYVNIDKALLFGYYIDSRFDFDPDSYSGFSMYAAYSYMGSKVKDDFTGGTKRIDDQPAHLINLRIEYLNTNKRINLSTGLNYNSKRVIAAFTSDDNVDIASTHEAPYFTLAARIKYYIGSSGSFYLAGDNLLMQAVKINQGSVTESYYPGAIIRLGLSLNIQGSR